MGLFHFPKTIRYDNGDVYKGDVKNGAPEGKGVMTYANGSVYEGELFRGKRHGMGKMTYADGKYYEGEFFMGSPGGGVMRYPNGDVYEGSFVDSKRSGPGVMTYANGEVYDGLWLDDKPAEEDKLPASRRKEVRQSAPKTETKPQTQSRGKLVLEDGSVYEGEMRDGVPNGKGTLRCVGHEWYEDLFFDSGTWSSRRNQLLSSENGRTGAEVNVYEGAFQDGKRSGYGKILYANGSTFQGYFRDGLPYQGKGMVYARGDSQPLAYIELDNSTFGGAQDGVSVWWIWPNTQR